MKAIIEQIEKTKISQKNYSDARASVDNLLRNSGFTYVSSGIYNGSRVSSHYEIWKNSEGKQLRVSVCTNMFNDDIYYGADRW